ncbi:MULTISPECIES: DUF2637 domain-containing protein [unclassified Streptomyces]|uniref:DUF2637 domain-containing protein n=1 Tax=unclassified Streptomyces TaxID=2593676 RepID=UPI00081F7348|nr:MULTISPECIES: DUF2637 domain-containing protein [unclassified Streptomyces]MYR27796.1 DUF2637 domain-containing protein [Streptomyces sp. SID4945]SCF29478.1 Protein of unknown function [Streptomyces sp. LcepLS]
MTLTDWPPPAADPTPETAAPAAVSRTPQPVSQTPAAVSRTPEFVSRTETGTGTSPSPGRLTSTQKWATGAIVVAALALAGIGLYLSFAHVATFAFEKLRFGSLHKGELFAVGVDVGIMIMIAVDLLMAWLNRPVSWIRYPVWFLTGVTVVLNAASGAPKPGQTWTLMDYVAAGAHGVVPVLFIAVVELGRDAINRVVRPEQGERDAIPWLRWLLAPLATARIFRRMRLWGITSYPEMIRRDQQLIAYEQWLKRKHQGDLSQASEDELLPMTMAPYGYTVTEALALPDEQEQAAQQRTQDAEQRALDAATRSEIAQARSETERLRAKGSVEQARAEVDGQTGQARAQARAQVTAAERAAEIEAAALESALVAEARAREAEANRKTAQEREAQAQADARAAELERQAAQKRKEAAEADQVAAAEAQAVETQAIAEARRATAEADRVAAETEKAAAETRRAAAETDRKTAEQEALQAEHERDTAIARKAAAEADRRVAETRLAVAEIEKAAAEAEDTARLKPRERAVRRVARLALAEGAVVAGLDAEAALREVSRVVSIADIQREAAITSPGTASEYRQEATELLMNGYRPTQQPQAV